MRSRGDMTTSSTSDLQALLRRAGAVRSACDLDLLVFLWRHPRALLTSDRLAQMLGRTVSQVASSLDVLLERGWLARSQNPTGTARLYLLLLEGPSGEAARRLIVEASDPVGRRAVLRALDGHAGEPPGTLSRARGPRRVSRGG